MLSFEWLPLGLVYLSREAPSVDLKLQIHEFSQYLSSIIIEKPDQLLKNHSESCHSGPIMTKVKKSFENTICWDLIFSYRNTTQMQVLY